MVEDLKPINIIRASAGTGKTFRLATEFSRNLKATNGNMGATKIIATTFTNKAANELTHRIRTTLLRDGRWDEAQALFVAHIGTVNSVCGRIVADLAIEAGLSPSVRIIDELQQSEVFQMAVEEVSNSYGAKLWRTIYRMGKEDSWRNDVLRIADIARQNNIEPSELKASGLSSWQTFSAMLPNATENQETFEIDLHAELRLVLSRLPIADDETDITANGIEDLKELDFNWETTKDLTWGALIKISKLWLGKRSQPVIQKLKRIALRHSSLHLFHEDIKHLTLGMFNCAADCLEVYKQFKEERGLLDFVDQELLALKLLRDSAIRSELNGRFSTLLIDEFQDTSPIQLAIFLELARIVNSSTWVGDEKQSVFGFRGSDPILMQQVVAQLLPATGGTQTNLATSYRSRPQLVSFVNSIFIPAMNQIGIAVEDIEIKNTARMENGDLNTPVNLWWLGSGSQNNSIKALAQGVLEVLLSPREWMVPPAKGGELREIRGGDIAILCRSNSRRIEIADELSKLGLMVSTERTGLLQTPECVLSISIFRFLADRYDTLAMAEIIRYTDTQEDDSLWLYDLLEKGKDEIISSNKVLQNLEILRHELLGLTPMECLQSATTAPFVQETILSWGNSRQRLLNLEALLGIAESYEKYCTAGRQTATNHGLVNFINQNNREAFQPANPDEQAVQVLTYHKAKGLEWPMVIMCDLDSPPPAVAFGVHIQKSKNGFDASNPLADRTVRYWPWPYGKQKSKIELSVSAQNSPEMEEVEIQRYAENLRLLYVGMTRARDYLVLSCQENSDGANWLHMAKDIHGESLFELSPGSTGMKNILRNTTPFLAHCKVLAAPDQVMDSAALNKQKRYTAAVSTTESEVFLPYSCTASGLKLLTEAPNSSIVIDKEIHLGSRLNFSESMNMRSLGDAFHQFLAIDEAEQDLESRLQCASIIAANYKIDGLNSAQFLEASDRLWQKLNELYPDANWLREWPVSGRRGPQRITGTIDLLLECSEGYVIIDHKSFPGRYETWKERAISHYPQLDAYAELVKQATKKDVIGLYIHMPVAGSLLKLKAVGDWTSEETLQLDEYELDIEPSYVVL